MTARRDQHAEVVWLGSTHALHACAMMHAKGMMDGRIAASSHAPEFLSTRSLLQAAWEVACTQQELLHPAQQDEYFVGWVQGYGQRVDETSDEPLDNLGTWDDDGGAPAVPCFDA